MRMTVSILLIGLLAGVPAWAEESCPSDGCGRCADPTACHPPARTEVIPPAAPILVASAPVLYSETQWATFRELAARIQEPADSPWTAADILTESDIITLMTAVREGIQTHSAAEQAWHEFEYRQHDDTTVKILCQLYRNHDNEKVQRMALRCLSQQNRSGLLFLWDEILRDFQKKDQWPFAARGLCSINSPESFRILFDILSKPDTESELLATICALLEELKLYEEITPVGGLAVVSPLLGHPSSNVRFAAYKASLALGANRNELLMQALSDTETPIIRWGLRCLGPNLADQVIPRVLELLKNSAPDIRVQADEALRYFISQASDNLAGRFEIMRQALEENRWSYSNAPLLTSRFGKLLEERGQLVEAARAYTAGESSYSRNSAYRAVNFNPGATMLYRLVQVNRKMNDLDAARAVAARLAAEYPGGTKIYIEDNPVSLSDGWHMISTAGEVSVILINQLVPPS